MPSKNKSSKSKKSVKVEPVVEPVVESVVEPVGPVEPEPEPVVDTPSESSVESVEEFDYTSEFTILREGLRDALNLVKTLTSQLSDLEKRVSRDRKMVQKRLSKKPRRASTGLNGFSKPGPVSVISPQELAGLPKYNHIEISISLPQVFVLTKFSFN